MGRGGVRVEWVVQVGRGWESGVVGDAGHGGVGWVGMGQEVGWAESGVRAGQDRAGQGGAGQDKAGRGGAKLAGSQRTVGLGSVPRRSQSM